MLNRDVDAVTTRLTVRRCRRNAFVAKARVPKSDYTSTHNCHSAAVTVSIFLSRPVRGHTYSRRRHPACNFCPFSNPLPWQKPPEVGTTSTSTSSMSCSITRRTSTSSPSLSASSRRISVQRAPIRDIRKLETGPNNFFRLQIICDAGLRANGPGRFACSNSRTGLREDSSSKLM